MEYPVALSLLSLSKEDRVLDIGCKDSCLPDFLNHSGHTVTGIDIRPVAGQVLHPGNFICGTSVSLPFKSDVFDKIVCVSVLNFLKGSDDILSMKEMLRVLKPGGSIFLSFEMDAFESIESTDHYTMLRRYSKGSAKDRLLSFPHVKLQDSGIFHRGLLIRKFFERHHFGASLDFLIPFFIPFFVVLRTRGFLKPISVKRGSFGYFLIQKRQGSHV